MRQKTSLRAAQMRPLVALLLLVLLVAGCASPAAPAAEAPAAEAPAGGPVVNTLGRELPADAAPLAQQVLVYPYTGWATFTTLDMPVSVYERADGITDVLSESLIRLDKNFQVQPGAATDWSVDESGLVWTFNLDPNLIWTDGTPVTADDYVATFQFTADPEHAWDFTWYWAPVIANYDAAVKGEVSIEEIGVVAADEHTLQITTVAPAPYLPAMLIFSNPLQRRALEEHGPYYNADPATSVSSGPYKLVEWTKDVRYVYEINEQYKGTNVPYLEKLIVVGYAQGTQLPAYQNNELDFVWGNQGVLSPADLEIIQADPTLFAEYHPHQGDFRTYYFFVDDTKPPFDDLRVRQAFAHLVNRDAIVENLVKISGIPAYSFLMPGFPAANSEAFQDTFPYDPEQAKALLAEAGYPDGAGFPPLVLALRAEPALPTAIAQAYAADLSAQLGIQVEVQNMERDTFTEGLNADPTTIQFGFISYGMDYLDASNMLGVFRSGGRHTWSNAEFDALLDEANSFTGDPAERTAMYQEAERILVEDVGGIFTYHVTPGDLIKPFLGGPALEPDDAGFAAWHWPYFASFSDLLSGVYIKDNVSDYRSAPPQ